MTKGLIYLLSLFMMTSCFSSVNYLNNNDYGQQNPLPKHVSHQTRPNEPFKPEFLVSDIVYSLSGVKDVHHASELLGIDIFSNDDIPLFMEAASWIGTPYLHAGYEKSGTDCSGLSYAIFKKLYGKTLDRRSDGQFLYNCYQIPRNELRAGDLVFFNINKGRISHVGIYLKDNKFIHASSYRGVVVNDLDENYYKRYFYAAGRVK